MTWAPDYVELETMLAYLRSAGDDATEDDLVSGAITAASRAVDRSCGRQFGKVGTSTVRRYTAALSRQRGRYTATIDDLSAAAGLTVTSAGVAVTDYTLMPLNAEADGRPYTWIIFGGTVSTTEGDISLTSIAWGWAAVPASIVQATELQASRLSKRRDAPFGVAGSPEMGSELRLLARLDPDVEVLLTGYRRIWGAV